MEPMTQIGFVFGCITAPVFFVLSGLFFYSGFISNANLFTEVNLAWSIILGTASFGACVGFAVLFYSKCKDAFFKDS